MPSNALRYKLLRDRYETLLKENAYLKETSARGGRASKRLVVLESPFGGSVRANQVFARACVKDCLVRGESVIASHLLYTQPGLLDDNIESQRSLGMLAGWVWKEVADATVVYLDRGISSGMAKGIQYARERGLPIEWRRLDGKEIRPADFYGLR